MACHVEGLHQAFGSIYGGGAAAETVRAAYSAFQTTNHPTRSYPFEPHEVATVIESIEDLVAAMPSDSGQSCLLRSLAGELSCLTSTPIPATPKIRATMAALAIVQQYNQSHPYLATLRAPDGRAVCVRGVSLKTAKQAIWTIAVQAHATVPRDVSAMIASCKRANTPAVTHPNGWQFTITKPEQAPLPMFGPQSKIVAEIFPALDPVLRQIANDYEPTHLSMGTIRAGDTVSHDEGDRIWYVDRDGRTLSVEMVAEHNLGAAGVRHTIGEMSGGIRPGMAVVRMYRVGKKRVVDVRICQAQLEKK